MEYVVITQFFLTDFPKPRSGHRLVFHGCSIYSFGGYNPKISSEEYNDELWLDTKPLFKEVIYYTLNSNT